MASQTIQPAYRFRQRSARAADPLQKAILVESERQSTAEVRRIPPLHSTAPPISPAAPNPSVHAIAPAAKAVSATDRAQASAAAGQESAPSPLPVQAAPELAPAAKYARDDTTPIPRPSTYYGREHYHDVREENAHLVRQAARETARRPFADTPSLLLPQARPGQIDKSALPLGEPKRIRDKEHLKFVAR